MQIDWFTLLAQIVNFGILVFLLQRFLYGPIVGAMEEREQKIASRLEEADRRQAEAEEEAAEYREEQERLKEQRERLASRAEEEVEERKEKLLEQTRGETEETQRRWREAIKREQRQFLRDLRERASEQVVKMVRQALKELADADLEDQMLSVFIGRMRQMDDQQRKAMAESIEKSGGELVVGSTYDIPDDRREALVSAIAAELFDGDQVRARFERSDDLVCGIEIRADGRKLAWSIQDYMEGVEEHVMQTLQAETGAEGETEAAES